MSKTDFRGEIPPAVAQLKEATREAHEAFQALRDERRLLAADIEKIEKLRDEALDEMFKAVRAHIGSIITELIVSEVTEYKKIIDESIEVAAKQVIDHFDNLMKSLTNTSAAAIRKGQPDLYDLVEAVREGSLTELPDFQELVQEAAEKEAIRIKERERRDAKRKSSV